MTYSDLKPNQLQQIIFINKKLRLKDNERVYIKNYRNPHNHIEEIKSQVQKLIVDQIVEPSVSEYNSPLLLVPKKALPDSNKKDGD